MSSNKNQNIPRYAESDLNKAKIVKPPRIKNKERDLYFYSTLKTVDEVENTTASLGIQAKYEKTLKVQITTPLNFDIAKPKFASISDSGIWGTQLNGFIYEDIDLDTSKYNFVTFSLLQQSDIKVSEKLRIVNIDKVYDSNDKFVYASISLVAETEKTIKAILKFNWTLVQEFQADVKTKYIKIEIESKSIVFANGINISVLPEIGLRRVNDGISLNSLNIDLVLKLIKIRQTGPIEYDDLTLSDLNERVNRGDGKSYIRADTEKNNVGQASGTGTSISTPTAMGWKVTNVPSYGRERVNQITYFSKGILIKNDYISENKLSLSDVSSFLKGTYSIDGNLIEKDDTVSPVTGLKKLTDLSISSDDDRKYFILTKQSDLTKYLKLVAFRSGGTYTVNKNDNFPKTRLLTEQEFGNNFINDDPIVFEIELQREGFNPNIKLAIQNSGTVKFTQYDANHKIIGTPELQFETEFAFDDSKILSEFQL